MTLTPNVTPLINKEQLASKPKYQVFNIFLAQGTLQVYLDPKVIGVEVPHYLKEEQVVMFEIGYDMEIPIADLVISPQAFEATLSFNRTPTAIYIPWDAVIAITDLNNHGVVWQPAGGVHTDTQVEARSEKPVTRTVNNSDRRKMFKVLDGGKK